MLKKAILIILIIFGGAMLLFNRGMGEIKNMTISEVNISNIEDGIYEGEFATGRWSNKVEVTVKNQKIEDIKIIEGGQSDITSLIVEKIKDSQSLSIDTVSGASVTTKAFLKAVEDALAN